MTQQQLTAIIGSSYRAGVFIAYLNATMENYQINTDQRIACFLGQTAYESTGFKYTQEIASGREYEGRADLGNTEQGDGVKFKGRGLIQVTGRDNYKACSLALFGDNRLLTNPDLLVAPQFACMSAGWYWSSRDLNDLADRIIPGNLALFTKTYKAITRKINGGLLGYDDRVTYYDRAMAALG